MGFPIEIEGANGGEGGGDAVEDEDVDVVAEVDPDEDEGGEVGGYDAEVEVGEGFGGLWIALEGARWRGIKSGKQVVGGGVIAYREKEIADVVCNIYRQSHICEMETITQPDQGECDDMVADQFFEITPGLLEE